jgi:hypothetical protein
MMLPGVSRDRRIPFAGSMIKLLLRLGFQEEFPREADSMAAQVDTMTEKAAKPRENGEVQDCRATGGG